MRQITVMLLLILLQAVVLAQEEPRSPFRVNGLIANGDLGDPRGWAIEGFKVEDARYLSRKRADGRIGTASTIFNGPVGLYTIRVQYLDEGDGVSRATLEVNGRQVAYWEFDGILVDVVRWHEVPGVQLAPGDTITLAGRANAYEYCRLAGVEILPAEQAEAQPRASIEDLASRDFSFDLVPLPEQARAGLSGSVPPLALPFCGGAGTYLIYVEAGEPLVLQCFPSYLGYATSVVYALSRPGAADPLLEGTLRAETSEPIFLRLGVPGAGLYELRVAPAPGARGSVKVRFDCPGVTAPSGSEGFFYVPAGTRTFGVRLGGHAVVLDGAGRVVLDRWLDKGTPVLVSVPPGSDGQVWMFQGELAELAGVPPYVAHSPEALLVPSEVAGGAGR